MHSPDCGRSMFVFHFMKRSPGAKAANPKPTKQHKYKLKRSNNVSATHLEEISDTLRKTLSTATECKLFATSVADAANKVLKNAKTPITLHHYLKRKT